MTEYAESHRSQEEWNRIERKLEMTVTTWQIVAFLAFFIGGTVGAMMAR